MVSITPSLNLRYELNFFFEFNQSSIELYLFVNTTNTIFSLLTKFINNKSTEITKKIESHIGVKLFSNQ